MKSILSLWEFVCKFRTFYSSIYKDDDYLMSDIYK